MDTLSYDRPVTCRRGLLRFTQSFCLTPRGRRVHGSCRRSPLSIVQRLAVRAPPRAARWGRLPGLGGASRIRWHGPSGERWGGPPGPRRVTRPGSSNPLLNRKRRSPRGPCLQAWVEPLGFASETWRRPPGLRRQHSPETPGQSSEAYGLRIRREISATSAPLRSRLGNVTEPRPQGSGGSIGYVVL